jgi:hypothetical protein
MTLDGGLTAARSRIGRPRCSETGSARVTVPRPALATDRRRRVGTDGAGSAAAMRMRKKASGEESLHLSDQRGADRLFRRSRIFQSLVHGKFVQVPPVPRVKAEEGLEYSPEWLREWCGFSLPRTRR